MVEHAFESQTYIQVNYGRDHTHIKKKLIENRKSFFLETVLDEVSKQNRNVKE